MRDMIAVMNSMSAMQRHRHQAARGKISPHSGHTRRRVFALNPLGIVLAGAVMISALDGNLLRGGTPLLARATASAVCGCWPAREAQVVQDVERRCCRRAPKSHASACWRGAR